MELNDLILSSRLFIPGKETEFVTIKPKWIPKENSTEEIVYWFVIYDLC
jgi:hypothetical protein